MKLACVVGCLLFASSQWRVGAANSDESVLMFIDEVKYALRSQWEILQNIRQHILINKVWLGHLLAELNSMNGGTRVNRRNSLAVEEAALSGADDFLDHFQTILNELQGLELELNETATSWKRNNYGNEYKISTKGASLHGLTVAENVTRSAVVNEMYEEPNAMETQEAAYDNLSTSTTAPSMMTILGDLREVVAVLEDLNTRFNDHPALLEEENSPSTTTETTVSSTGDMIAVLTQLKQLYHQHFGGQNVTSVAMAITLQPTTKFNKLSEVIESLRDLASYLRPPQIHTTLPTPPASCDPPLQEIAYRMCILQVTNKRLNWFDAGNYCRSLGGELAQDAVVIKTRRFLNEMYGEQGTRVRWPFWVGASEVNDGDGWRWEWQEGGSVPDFLWSHKQPRYYPEHLAPRGTCMTLDGFQAFYGAALPCHFRRRFVCQMWK